MSAPVFGTGSTLSFGTSNFVANIVSINFGEVKRADKKTTHLGTTVSDTFTPVTLYDPGECKFKIQFNPAKGNTIPITGAAETVTLTFGTGTPSLAGSAFVIGYAITIQTEEIIEADITLKYSGALTWANQS